MNRRHFMKTAGVATMAGILSATGAAHAKKTGNTFKLKYAPHFGMFKNHAGEDELDQLQFMADEGFSALEDNWMTRRDIGEQERIARKLGQLNMEMGVFVASANFQSVDFASNKPADMEEVISKMKQAVEVAKRVNAKWCTVVPGTYSRKTPWDYQTAYAIENLKRCAEICEPSGLVMVLESLNPHTDHPGLFLTEIPQAYMICKSVGSPSCKVLDDLYHQQITEGNLIPNIDQAWDEIAYFQTGDNPGRKEPTTGEINYLNVFKHIHAKGFTGIIGMEHGNSQPGKKGERAVIDAYIQSDNF